MTKSIVDTFVSDRSKLVLYQQERAVLAVTELICEAMAEQKITRSQLAKKLGRSKGWVTQLLDEESNHRIRTIVDALTTIGQELIVSRRPIQGCHISSSTNAEFKSSVHNNVYLPVAPEHMRVVPSDSSVTFTSPVGSEC